MKRKVSWLVLFTAAIAVTALYQTRNVMATVPNAGFVPKTLASGRFGEIEVFNKSVVSPSHDSDSDADNDRDERGEHRADVWLSLQKTKGSSDLYVQSNAWAPVTAGGPGGSTGWHTHPGHSLIIVTAGSVTEYDGDDPQCKPHIYTATPGLSVGFVDPGGNHVHLIRNEGSVPAQAIAVQLIPAGATRRIDVVPAPASCPADVK
jgi:hypothetical protein